MTNIILHVGTPKTGSSYLQRVLAKNRNNLKEHGFYCAPENVNEDHRLFRRLDETDDKVDIGRIFQDYVESITRSGSCIISYEWFSDARQEMIESLSEINGYNFKVVMYVRSPASYAESAYKQWFVKSPEFASFEDFLVKWRHPTWHRNATIWSNKGHQVHIVPYIPAEQDVLTQFARLVDPRLVLENKNLETDGWDSNPSLNRVGTQITKLLGKRYILDDHRLKYFLREHASKSCFESNFATFSLMTRRQVKEYNQRNIDILEKLSNFGFAEVETLLQYDEKSRYPQEEQSSFDDEKLNEILLDILGSCVAQWKI